MTDVDNAHYRRSVLAGDGQPTPPTTAEDDEQLLLRFFGETALQPIADDGFTERVMQRLPAAPKAAGDAGRRFQVWWNAACVAVFVVLFVVFRGWELLAVHFEVMLRTLAAESFHVNIAVLASVLFGLIFVGVGETVSRA